MFLELTDGTVATFDWSFPTGSMTDRHTEISYRSPNQALHSGNYSNRVGAYRLDSGSRAGDDNAWCNFKCSGCFRPLQAARWFLYESGAYRGMKAPENSLGRFQGARGTEMDNAGLRPYPPHPRPTPRELGDSVCWHFSISGTTCEGLSDYYGISLTRFF